jgi:hypothetical protein
MARAHGSSESKTRREEELMLFHHDDEQRSIRRRTPMRPKGYGDVRLCHGLLYLSRRTGQPVF